MSIQMHDPSPREPGHRLPDLPPIEVPALERRQYWMVVHIDTACPAALSDQDACDAITKHLHRCGGLGAFSLRSGLRFTVEPKQFDRGVIADHLDDAFSHLHLDDGQVLPVVAYLDDQGQQVHASQRFTAAHRVVAGPTKQGYMMVAYVAEVRP